MGYLVPADKPLTFYPNACFFTQLWQALCFYPENDLFCIGFSIGVVPFA